MNFSFQLQLIGNNMVCFDSFVVLKTMQYDAFTFNGDPRFVPSFYVHWHNKLKLC